MVLKESVHPHINKVLPDVQMESPVFKFVHITCSPGADHY